MFRNELTIYNTHIIHMKVEVPGQVTVKDPWITDGRHLYPLYCLRCYKTIFMFTRLLSNPDILKTSNNTWLDPTNLLFAVQICLEWTFTESSQISTKHCLFFWLPQSVKCSTKSMSSGCLNSELMVFSDRSRFWFLHRNCYRVKI